MRVVCELCGEETVRSTLKEVGVVILVVVAVAVGAVRLLAWLFNGGNKN